MEKGQTCNSSQFKHAQVFGQKCPIIQNQDQDVISVIKFDKTGQFIALGDYSGRVIIFNAPQNKKKGTTYDYCTEFQSHSRLFDPLRSTQIPETINDITWMRQQGKYLKMITANMRDIKIWKIFDRPQRKVAKSSGLELHMPKMQTVDSGFCASIQKTFPAKHGLQINSLSNSFNEEYLLSSDQGQIFLWSMQKPQTPFQVVDLKLAQNSQNPANNESCQTINCSVFHPSSDSIFAFGTTKGNVKLGDLRASALCDSALNFYIEPPGNKNFFTEIISSISSLAFNSNGRHIVSRDYMTVKVWDLANTKKPVNTISVQDSLRAKLCQMYENQAVLDKFKVAVSHDSNSIITGNYNSCFHMMDANSGNNYQFELSYKKQTVVKQIFANKMTSLPKIDYQRKTMACDFHPTKNLAAVSCWNSFFLYSM